MPESHWLTSVACNPVLNQCMRCSDVPCVYCRGEIELWVSVSSPIWLAALIASSTSPLSRYCCSPLAHMPAKQSACSSTFTDLVFVWSCLFVCRCWLFLGWLLCLFCS